MLLRDSLDNLLTVAGWLQKFQRIFFPWNQTPDIFAAPKFIVRCKNFVFHGFQFFLPSVLSSCQSDIRSVFRRNSRHSDRYRRSLSHCTLNM